MNNLVACGHIGRIDELKYAPSGTAVVKFSIADSLGKKDGEELTQWFACTAFGKVAELISTHFEKGKPIWVSGTMHARLYERGDGGTGLSVDVTVDAFKFVSIGTGQKNGQGGGGRQAPEPSYPEPPAARAAAPASGPGDLPDITDPFADQ